MGVKTDEKADQYEIVKLILEKSSIDLANDNTTPCLEDAIINNNTSIVKMSLEKGASVGNKEESGYCNAVHVAVSYGTPDIVELVLKAGGNLNTRARSCNFMQFLEKTPLVLAVQRGDPEIAKLLLDYDADVNGASLFSPMDGYDAYPLDFALAITQ